MNLDFSNKTVIITGGTRGMGAAMVNGFCNAGANVVMTGTKTPEDLTTDIPNYPQNIRYHQLDYSDNKSVKEFIYSVNKLERVDALINNAGVNKIETITEISLDDWDWIHEVNLRGPFLLTQAVSKRMKEQNSGKIINIASIFSVVSKVKRAAYSSTKWGLIGFTKAVDHCCAHTSCTAGNNYCFIGKI